MSERALSSAAVDGLCQLFIQGPTSDGDVISKSGRDELVDAGLAFRVDGFASLTLEGVKFAAAYDVRRSKPMTELRPVWRRWYQKQHGM